jgi:two-component system, LytTR family, sensor kinase
VASAATDATLRVGTRLVPKTTSLYWISQAAGWSGFLAYVLVGYFFWGKELGAADIVSIVVFCTIVPILLTHGLRHWMYVHQWQELREWRRKARQFPAAVLLAVIVTLAVGLANGLGHGRIWIPIDGMFWMLAAYWWAFGFWIWFYELAHQRRRREQLELIAHDAQLRALRAQLNPHFLFNSLNSVRSLITENPQRAASMVTGLSEILRYSLASDRKDTVPLADELSVIDEYLSVERVRFEDRLRVERTIDPRALPVPVPPMIVQTLVENAVKHGISMSSNGGIVRIDAGVHDGRLDVVVTNSGPFKPAVEGGRYGLQNATERLQLLYGGRASLTIKADGDRTIAALSIPVERAG